MKFTTGEIISAGIGRLCCPMERVYEIMNHLTGDNLFTHQLPRAFRTCKDWVFSQHPWLKELNESDCERLGWEKWTAEASEKYGNEHELAPMPSGWKTQDALEELAEMVGDKTKLVVVKV